MRSAALAERHSPPRTMLVLSMSVGRGIPRSPLIIVCRYEPRVVPTNNLQDRMKIFTTHTTRYVVTAANRTLRYTTNCNYLKSHKILDPTLDPPADDNIRLLTILEMERYRSFRIHSKILFVVNLEQLTANRIKCSTI